MPKYRNKATGEVREFPTPQTEAQLDAAFGATPPSTQGRGLGEMAAEEFAAPTVGAMIGGKTPLGPVGAGIGAAAGQGYGDIARMLGASGMDESTKALTDPLLHPIQFAHNWAARNTGIDPARSDIPSSMDEAQRLGMTGGSTMLGAKYLPKVLKLIPSLKGAGLAESVIAGALGSPKYAALGAVLEGAHPLGEGLESLVTPQGAAEGQAAAQASRDFQVARNAEVPAPSRTSPTEVSTLANAAGRAAREKVGQHSMFDLATVPDYLQHPLDSAISGAKNAGNAVSGAVSDTYGAIKNAIGKGWSALDDYMQPPPGTIGGGPLPEPPPAPHLSGYEYNAANPQLRPDQLFSAATNVQDLSSTPFPVENMSPESDVIKRALDGLKNRAYDQGATPTAGSMTLEDWLKVHGNP